MTLNLSVNAVCSVGRFVPREKGQLSDFSPEETKLIAVMDGNTTVDITDPNNHLKMWAACVDGRYSTMEMFIIPNSRLEECQVVGDGAAETK